MAQVVTASRLTDGVVVFLDPDGRWSERLDRAKLFADKVESAAGLETGKAAEVASLVVDVYAIDVTTPGRPRRADQAPRGDPRPRPHHPPRIHQARFELGPGAGG